MKRMLKGLFGLSLLISVAALNADTKTYGMPFFNHRSQGANLAREHMMSDLHASEYDSEDMKLQFMSTGEYTKSFDRDNIGTYLFFNGRNEMKFGNPINNNPAIAPTGDADVDVNAYNFGLGENFEGSVVASPRVENVVVDFGLEIELNEWLEGLWVRVNAPLTWTRWKMNLVEGNPERNGDPFLAGQMKNRVNGAQIPNVNNSIIEAWKGNNKFGDMQLAWDYGKIDDTQKNTKIGLADLELMLGWKYRKEKWYAGINLRGVIPTGNKSKAEYVFEPMLGNGSHGEIGVGLDGQYIFADKDTWTMRIIGHGYATHLLENTQKRSFDFTKNGIGSRYLLLKEFNANTYQQRLVNAINITTLDTKVKIDVQGEALVMLAFQREGFSAEFGYEFWGRSKEKLTLDKNSSIPRNKYGFLGILGNDGTGAAAGYADIDDINNSVAKDITIKGTNVTSLAIANGNYVGALDTVKAAAPGAYSHKVFGDFSYSWWNKENKPYVGIALEGEFSGKKNNALDQWGVMVKGGFCY